MAKEKTPQEASNIFHSIMKASVTPKATGAKDKIESHLEKFVSAVKDKFGIDIMLDNGIKYPDGTNENIVIAVQKFYQEFKTKS